MPSSSLRIGKGVWEPIMTARAVHYARRTSNPIRSNAKGRGSSSLLSVIGYQQSTINRALKSSLGNSASLTFVH